MKVYDQLEVWFVTGSQHLYGQEALNQVDEDSRQIALALSQSDHIPINIVFKPVLTTPDAIYRLCLEANASHSCVGLLAWMHTFSPSRMWIEGLKVLQKPSAHLHTQFNRDIPWASIDMDFMNLNQSAHGGREFGFLGTRMKRARKVIVGHWQDEGVQEEISTWVRAVCAWHDLQGARIARFGDNMREVAVTEGDKVKAQIELGYAVNGYGVGDLVEYVGSVSANRIDNLVSEYHETYEIADSLRTGEPFQQSIREAAKIELGLRTFLEEGNFKGFTTTFEDLHGLAQLPGIAVQRLMADGFGFGAEGDWKTAALVRAMKVMGTGLAGGTSFMEDYTYHFAPGHEKVLGAHMLEICPTIAAHKPSLEIHPLSIGGKADPVRLVFDTPPGPGVNASLITLNDRFRLLANVVVAVEPDEALPMLPVARAVWLPQPSLKVAAAAWILAGGAHHTGFSQSVTVEHLEDFAEIAGLEFLLIDSGTTLREFKKELRWNQVHYHLVRGL